MNENLRKKVDEALGRGGPSGLHLPDWKQHEGRRVRALGPVFLAVTLVAFGAYVFLGHAILPAQYTWPALQGRAAGIEQTTSISAIAPAKAQDAGMTAAAVEGAKVTPSKEIAENAARIEVAKTRELAAIDLEKQLKELRISVTRSGLEQKASAYSVCLKQLQEAQQSAALSNQRSGAAIAAEILFATIQLEQQCQIYKEDYDEALAAAQSTPIR